MRRFLLFKKLSHYFELTFDQDTPDVLIYSCYGTNFRKYRTTRIYFTGENSRPNYHHCDFSLSYRRDRSGRNVHFPYYLFGDLSELEQSPRPSFGPKQKFCNFIYNNAGCEFRNQFYHALSKHRKINAAGKVFNNTPGLKGRFAGGYRQSKIDFIKPFKFTLAFENESYPGYTTEKLADALLAGTVPIYWGDPKVSERFNPAAFINCHDFPNMADAIDHVLAVDRDDDLYRKYLEAPVLRLGATGFADQVDRAIHQVAQSIKNRTGKRAYQSLQSRVLYHAPPRIAHKLIRIYNKVMQTERARMFP